MINLHFLDKEIEPFKAGLIDSKASPGLDLKLGLWAVTPVPKQYRISNFFCLFFPLPRHTYAHRD